MSDALADEEIDSLPLARNIDEVEFSRKGSKCFCSSERIIVSDAYIVAASGYM